KPTPKISLLRQRTTTDLVREQVIAGLKKRKLETQRATYLEQVNEVLRQKNNAEQALENLKQLNARRKIKEERRALKQQKRPAQQARPTQTHTLTPQRRPSTVPPQQTPPTPLAPPKHAKPRTSCTRTRQTNHTRTTTSPHTTIKNARKRVTTSTLTKDLPYTPSNSPTKNHHGKSALRPRKFTIPQSIVDCRSLTMLLFIHPLRKVYYDNSRI
ncbi:MAG: hypothetical protein J4432_05585, partial [DPANN group archaeon]|nr:hypothetical protein [DPANN group archaeon]